MTQEFRSSRRAVLAFATVVSLTAVGAAVFPPTAYAYDENSRSAVNIDASGVALHGFDPVSYRSPGGPAKGSAKFSEKHDGAVYWFSSAANRAAFKANPDRFAPAYGGFCAMGVALEKKLDVNPQLWRIVNDKLYLNVHKEAQTRWLEDVKGNIEQADAIWSRIKDKAPSTL